MRVHNFLFLYLFFFSIFFGQSDNDCKCLVFQKDVKVDCVEIQNISYAKIYINRFPEGVESPVDIVDKEFVIYIPTTPSWVNYHAYESIDNIVGVSLDGFPIVSAKFDGIDRVEKGLKDNTLKIDHCGGSFSKILDGMRYYYLVMPSCIINIDRSSFRRSLYVNDIHQLLYYFKNKNQGVIGYTVSGHPIYSPLDPSGLLHKSLDNCNGKYLENQYGYYATPYYPYIHNCHRNHNLIKIKDLNNQTNDQFHTKSNISCLDGYFICERTGKCLPCPAGKYSTLNRQSNITGASYCNKKASIGYYSLQGSTSASKCPAGRYGSSEGLTDSNCSGPCRRGYFCPSASTRSDAIKCGNASYYCPTASGIRQLVDRGFYSEPEDTDESLRFSQRSCEPGHFCKSGIRYLCPAGRFGNEWKLSLPTCNGECPKGHYCPFGQSEPVPCPPGRYGDSLGLTNNSCSGACRQGYYCPIASISSTEIACPAGKYGAEEGLWNSNCSKLCSIVKDRSSQVAIEVCESSDCAAGYYCPEASTSSHEIPCGGVDRYCPVGFGLPVPVSVGYYSVSSMVATSNISEEMIRSSQLPCEPGNYCVGGLRQPCPSGRFGASYMLRNETCSGDCMRGYYCPLGSISAKEQICGPNSYCPSGSSVPLTVPKFYFAIGGTVTTRYGIKPCPPGYYCIGDGFKRPCPAGRYSVNGSSSISCDGLCSAGYYCLSKSSSPTQTSCPAGRYGFIGATDHFCSGPCAEGYYCTTNSSTPYQIPCGNNYFYCPVGSSAPTAVSKFYYSVGGTRSTRTGQNLCTFSEVLGTPPRGSQRINLCPEHTVL